MSDQVVRNATLLVRRWLVCQAFKSAVDLHRVGRDDLAIDGLCKGNRNRRLARRGRSKDRYHRALHRYTVTALTTWPRSVCEVESSMRTETTVPTGAAGVNSVVLLPRVLPRQISGSFRLGPSDSTS